MSPVRQPTECRRSLGYLRSVSTFCVFEQDLLRYLLALLLVLTSCIHAQDLDLGSRAQPLPAANRFAEKDFFVWCGAPVKGPDGKYHLFYSRWPVKVGFAPGWAIHSEIAYAITRDVVGTFSGSAGGICLFQSENGLHWKPAARPKVLESSFLLEGGSKSIARIERPALLIENDEPTYLFGAADGYQKVDKISTNVQIPLVP